VEAAPLVEGGVFRLQLIGFCDVVHLAVVNLRVEDAQRLRDRLDALVVHARGGVELARLLVVAGGVGGGELLREGDELGHFVLSKVDVGGDGVVETLLVRLVDGHGLAGNRERALADVRPAQARLAGGEVVARHERDRQVGRFAGGDVLALGDDAQAVAGEQVKLRHLVAGVVDLERARARFGAVGAHGAGVGVGGDLDAVGVGGVFHARRERQCQRQRGHGGEGSVV